MDRLSERSAAPRHLVVLFRPRLTLGLYGDRVPERLAGKPFGSVGVGPGGVAGLYDWLRTSAHRIVGLGMNFLQPDLERLYAAVASVTYIDFVPPSPYMSIYFDDPGSIDRQNSHDAAFGDSAIVASRDGEFGLVVELRMVDEADIETLKRVDADWISRV